MAIEAAIVSSLVKKLTPLLANRVIQEASLIIYFKEELQDLETNLRYIRARLNDAHRKKEQQEGLRTWLLDLQDVVYDAEDIIDKCEAQTLASAGRIGTVKPRYKMGRKMRELKKKIAKIIELGKSFNLRESAVDIGDPTRYPDINLLDRSLIVRDESKTVGMEGNTNVVTRWLSQKAHARIVAVVGMGGMGKTLLLHRVSDRTRPMFECSVWLTISQNYSIKKLQEKIGRQLKIDEVERLDEEEARISISSHLTGKSSLIVLDDVWTGKNLLQKIGIPEDNSCRVLISTRSTAVAEDMGDARIHQMAGLSEEDSWRLFCIHAFPKSDGVPPEELKGVAGAIAKKCANLPLAIITVAASMARKRPLPNEWNDALDCLNELPMENEVMPTMEKEVMPILQLSYDALRSPLQLCFLYCSAFTEDKAIDCQYVIELWIAEGFVTTTSDRSSSFSSSATDIGRCYLNELVSRCLLEPSVVGVDGRVEWCTMHDLLRDLALTKADRDLKCCFRSGNGLKQFPPEESAGYRRISLMQNDIQALPPIDKELKPLRALFLAGNENLREDRPPTFFDNLKSLRILDFRCWPPTFFDNLKSLRILDLSSTSISNFPESFGKLEHLRVLNLRSTKIKELPKSIKNLRRLQYLDLSWCNFLKILPAAIGGLKLLRHLNFIGCEKIEVIPKEISQLTSLQTLILEDYSLMSGKELRFHHLQNLTNLRELDAHMRVASELGIVAEHAFGRMKKMRRLTLYNHTCPIQLPDAMKDMGELERLYLYNFFPPSWLASFQNLVVMELHKSECTEYPRLDSLPNLCHLALGSNSRCRKFPMEFGRPGGFPKLEKLLITDLQILEELPVLEDGAMPKLKVLEVRHCPLLIGMPAGVEKLPCLVELTVLSCRRFQERLKQGAPDLSMLKESQPHLKIKAGDSVRRLWKRSMLRVINEASH